MKKRIYFFIIVYLVSLAVALTISVAEEQPRRETLETHPSRKDGNYTKYQADLEKILNPRQSRTDEDYTKYQADLEKILNPRQWDADLRYVLFPLAAIALAVVVIFFVRQIRMNLIREARDAVTETELEQVETERAALARAETAAAASDFRGALRFLYLSAILHLQERGVLPDDKSLTNREYLYQARSDIDLHAALGPAITVFDEVWYGHKPCDAETVANYRDLLQKVYAKA